MKLFSFELLFESCDWSCNIRAFEIKVKMTTGVQINSTLLPV